MESQRFDDISRMMASGSSRRTVLRGVFGSALAAVGLGGTAAAQADKVDICHRTGNGSYHWINVSVNALDADLAHGDFTDCKGNLLPDESCTCVCYLSDEDCGDGEIVNPDGTCTCVPEPEPVNQCADKSFQDVCAGVEASRCAESQDTGELVCIDWSQGTCGGSMCETSVDCTNSGWVCVIDGLCNGDPHCHPPV